jgi:hypothetical protein
MNLEIQIAISAECRNERIPPYSQETLLRTEITFQTKYSGTQLFPEL